jgi:hypothetical protein
MFRFTIRDLLWLMVVVGLGVCWYCEYRTHAADLSTLNAVRGERDKLQQTQDRMEQILDRSGFLWTCSRGVWYIVGKPSPKDLPPK